MSGRYVHNDSRDRWDAALKDLPKENPRENQSISIAFWMHIRMQLDRAAILSSRRPRVEPLSGSGLKSCP